MNKTGSVKIISQDRATTLLTNYIVNLRTKTRAPGISAAVSFPTGVTITAVTGFADVEYKISLTRDTRMLGGSTGKTFAAVTVLILVQDGLLNLDLPVSTWMRKKEWFNKLPNARDLTLRTLLNHTAGIPHYINNWGFKRAFFRDSFLRNDTGYSPEKMLGFIFGKNPVGPADAQHHYSDLGYFIVGLIIEEVTGQSYYKVLDEKILKPLKLDKMVYPQLGRDIPNLAPGYVAKTFLNKIMRIAGKNMTNGVLKHNPVIEYTGGGLATTPTALAIFYKGVVTSGLLSKETIDTMLASCVPIEPGSPTCYGLGVYITERGKLGQYISHAGWYPGYNTNAAFFMDHGFSVAIQVNTDYKVDIYPPVRDIADIMLDIPVTEHKTSLDQINGNKTRI